VTRNRGLNVVHRIELPRRKWPVRGRFELGWPVSAPPLASYAPATSAAPAAAATTTPLQGGSSAARRNVRPSMAQSSATETPRAVPSANAAADETAVQAKAEIQAKESAYQREIDLLERRLRKVQGLLDLREQELRRLLAAGKIDDGLRSIYTHVEGLDPNSPMAETKREMMAAIFEANRELQARLKGLSPKKPSGGRGSLRSGPA